MTITDVITEWGAVYRAGSASMKDLRKKLMEKSETEALFPIQITESTILEGARATFARVLQRFQKAWTPVGNVTITPEKILLSEFKIDLQETPDDLEASWLGFLADKNLDRKQWPFIRWWLENSLEKAAEDLEKTEIFAGVLGAITPGTPTAAGATMNGIKKLINNAITAGTCVPLVVGAPPTDPVLFVNWIEAFVALIPHLLLPELEELVMSKDFVKRFRAGMRLKYNVNYNQVDNLTTVIDTNLKLVGVTSHTGSSKIWTTPRDNRVLAIKKPKNQNIFQLENIDRTVKAYTDYWKGIGFWHYGYLFTNDSELPA